MYMNDGNGTISVVRGWPSDGALDRLETVTTGSTVSQGDVVFKFTDGTVQKTTSGTVTGYVGLVMKGNGDPPNTTGVTNSVVNAGNKAVVLWSNYIVMVSNYDTSPSPAWAPGVAVTSGGSATAAGKFTTITATTSATTASQVCGFCLNVIPATTGISGTTAAVVILVR